MGKLSAMARVKSGIKALGRAPGAEMEAPFRAAMLTEAVIMEVSTG